jgi:VCBS repeat-containing protein
MIENAALSPLTSTLNSFGNPIQGIGVGDIIDLAGLTFAQDAKVSYDPSTDILSVTSGGVTDDLTVVVPQGVTFALSSDGSKGTDVIAAAVPPTVVADRTSVNVGASVTADALHGVLANDRDPIAGDTGWQVSAVNGQAGNVDNVVAGRFGSLTIHEDGSYTYTASSNAVLPASGVGQDVFTYTAETGQGGTATSTLTVIVTAAGLNFIGGALGQTITSPTGGHSAVLDGGAGNNTLIAANGATVLIGGPGDTLTGGKGADTYVFTGHFGSNEITNYNPSKDIIELDKTEFTNLKAVHDATKPAGHNTVISDTAGDSITLIGINPSQLHFDASHFLLA